MEAIDLINIAGGSHITIDGLKLQHFNAYGIHSEGGSSLGQAVTTGNTFENNDIGFNTVTSWSSGGIFAEGASPDTTIVNNYVHDLGSFGISVTSWFAAGDSIDGSVIAHNVVTNTVERMSDGGAIYVGMHGGYQAPANGVQILDNFVSQTGAPGVGGVAGIYLDDNANDVLVSGNVIGPNNAGSGNASRADSEAFEIHNGHDNHITGNIVDLGSSGKEQTTFYFQDGGSFKGMSGNSFTGNVVVSDFSGSAHTSSGFAYAEYNGVSSDYTIQNNLYFNYGGGQVLTDGQLASDAVPW